MADFNFGGQPIDVALKDVHYTQKSPHMVNGFVDLYMQWVLHTTFQPILFSVCGWTCELLYEQYISISNIQRVCVCVCQCGREDEIEREGEGESLANVFVSLATNIGVSTSQIALLT